MFYLFRNVEGMVTLGHMMSQIMKFRAKTTDPVSKVLYKQFKQVGCKHGTSLFNGIKLLFKFFYCAAALFITKDLI